VTAVCENIFPPPGTLESLVRRALWPRLDGLLAVAPPSEQGIREAGMPASVPAAQFVVGGLEPAGDARPLPLPGAWATDDFVIGFAGRIVAEKGWHLIAEALEQLPASFRLAIAGDGPELGRLRELAETSNLAGRIHYVGLLPKGDLWRFYRAVDCLVVPSLTTPRWKEQVGSVIVDALALGLPVIGSSSGAIPSIVGDGGLVVPEGDAAAIATAVLRLRSEAGLAAGLGSAGLRRYREEFSIPAYAGKIASALGLHPRTVALGE
jgi:glycosyltransferase involved in cell wall biosynthesis